MTPPEPPSNPYDPNWPKPEQPYGQPEQRPEQRPEQPPEQPPTGQAPYAPYGQQQPYGQNAPYGQQPPYGQNVPYGQQPAYGAPSYGSPIAPPHPSATTAMVLGIGAIGGMFLCVLPIVLAPFAWIIGGRAVKEIDANPGRYSGRDQAQAGRILGMIGTGILVIGLVLLVVAVIGFVATSESSTYSYDTSP